MPVVRDQKAREDAMSDAFKIYGIGRTIGEQVFVVPNFPLFSETEDAQSFINCLENPIGKFPVEMQVVLPGEEQDIG